MKDRAIFAIILFFVLGSAAISGNPHFSQTAKSVFHGIGLAVLGLIGVRAFYNLFRGRTDKF